MSLAYDYNHVPMTPSSGERSIGSYNAMRPVASGRYPAVDASADLFTEYQDYDCADWDGYGAEPILSDTVRAARAFYYLLPLDGIKPDIAPGADGTIGFEWRSGSSYKRDYLLIDVGPGSAVTAKRISSAGVAKNYPVTTVTTGARALVSELLTP